ncbi:hypothetical protein FA10DRAFT_257519 [Acaromyces ingoldii]|uniref:Uncharacterized protein n=1 Tax=Acaromyces ingoldii TaxID=215250 RepID=A0A316YYL0_9BASI|nr:hypothetical protein FA10DRAFT_257519 [Acaromyces ingoldii]PWN93173.1 hypothetical protein FA10DRAFT_257519 [Acaromyces ingoldii]
MRYSSTLLLALHLAAVAQSTPVSSDTSGNIALANRSPSAAALDLQSLHYHKRTLFGFLRGTSKRDKERRRKGKDAGESSTRPLLADKDKAVDSSEGGSSLTADEREKWTQRPGERALHFWQRLTEQAEEYKAAGKLDEMGKNRIYGLGKAIFENDTQRAQDPYDLHAAILKVIDGTWGPEETLKFGVIKLLKRSANNESSNMRALKRPLLHDPNGWIRNVDSIDDYWKPRESETKTDFTTRIYNLADICYQHRIIAFKEKETLQNKILELRKYDSVPSEDKRWQNLLGQIQKLVRTHINVEKYIPGNNRMPKSPLSPVQSSLKHNFPFFSSGIYKRQVKGESSNPLHDFPLHSREPLLMDLDVWVKDVKNIEQHWKLAKGEDMEEFADRLKTQSEQCRRHEVFDEETMVSVNRLAEHIRRRSQGFTS